MIRSVSAASGMSRRAEAFSASLLRSAEYYIQTLLDPTAGRLHWGPKDSYLLTITEAKYSVFGVTIFTTLPH